MASQNKDIGIKKPHEVEYISKEEYQRRLKDIVHAQKDIVWWAEHYFHIVNMGTGLQLINLYPKQREMLDFIKNNDRVITLASRQVGKSTTYTIFCLWYAMYFNDKSIMICSNKLQTSVGIVQKIAKAYELIPKWLKPGVITYNKSEIAFSNGSSIRGYATGSSTARSASANCVVIDEMAFIPPNICSDFFASVMPVISSAKNTKAIIVSTPNGCNNLYYDLWKSANAKDASKNKEGWKPFRIDWWETGGIRDEAWKQQQIATIGLQRWRVEFGNEFLESDTVKKLIPDEVIENFRKKLSEYKQRDIWHGKDLAVFSNDKRKTYTIRMYHDFNPKRTYLCTSDIAEGIGKDSSVLYIWDVTDLRNIKMCLKFSDNNISILEFAYLTNEICKMYNNPFITCESNGISIGYIDQLRMTYEYQNLVRLNRGNDYGIQSHVQIKTKACLWARDMMTMEGFGFEIYDKEMVEEFGTFIKTDAKVHAIFRALGDNHDDHMINIIWLCFMLCNENVEHYFDVKEWFQNSLGNQYPRILQSLESYTQQDIERINSIVQVREFRLFKEQHPEEYGNEYVDVKTDNRIRQENHQPNTDDMMKMYNGMSMSQQQMQQMMRMSRENGYYRDNGGMVYNTREKIGFVGIPDNDFDDCDGRMW